ncbi:DUF7130 family rubredoxin-like protein [Halomarina pelagica]|uniref:DUF7130 family rubredoxin-like protein n=1 Tax=Halomarina pelagica TaxID=2961599 RepID=UPI0020C50AEB|nr:hypothetical protein [Halomarina sp. BND7]
MAQESAPIVVKPGQPIFDRDGNELGVIRGLSEEGFRVSTHESVDHVDLEHDPGRGFGEGYLVWRCAECGEVGELDDGLPDACPDCGAPKEDLYAWLED